MATDGNGFNGANKSKVTEQISNSANWTAYARVASVLSAPIGIIGICKKIARISPSDFLFQQARSA